MEESISKIPSPITRADQKRLAESIIRPLVNGDIDPLEFIVKVNGLKASLEEVLKDRDVKDIVINEVSKYGKSAVSHGATVSCRETGVKYDFSNCGDSVYERLRQQKAELDAEMKARESFLKNVSPGTVVVDPDTGEANELYPPVKTASESYVIQFGK